MNKTVLITGSSTGIGRAAALLFSKNGWNVVATMRTPEAEKELNQLENVLVNRLDLEDVSSIENSIQEATDRFGKIDLLVNNAAFGQYGIFEALKPEQIEKQFSVNVFGTMNVIRAVLPHFRAQKEGKIINVSSAGGRIGIPLISMYVSSKFALEGFSEALSYELASQNISLKLVEPGGVATPFHETSAQLFATNPELTSYDVFSEAALNKLGQMGDMMSSAEEVADEIFKAATDNSDQFRYIVGEDAKSWINDRTSMDDLTFARHMRQLFNS
ncbi:SDR family oxidoreductase [Chryseobacterium sp. MEBOG06]|uniref:SDR family oxidoreductase n=1 Tax=unclassified Chryseobacterium TaxID=2593645 RepID=UPI001F3B5DA9|nr:MULTISPECIES: SDR family oxidoreductase [unclassified Chryseobacterium]UKB82062.1 SDR family oxidoreductase [Chryseobacterium sp. MEBOG06]